MPIIFSAGDTAFASGSATEQPVEIGEHLRRGLAERRRQLPRAIRFRLFPFGRAVARGIGGAAAGSERRQRQDEDMQPIALQPESDEHAGGIQAIRCCRNVPTRPFNPIRRHRPRPGRRFCTEMDEVCVSRRGVARTGSRESEFVVPERPPAKRGNEMEGCYRTVAARFPFEPGNLKISRFLRLSQKSQTGSWGVTWLADSAGQASRHVRSSRRSHNNNKRHARPGPD